jgi:GNAT superfamily N-acetyltransferase
MGKQEKTHLVDSKLLYAWLTARSIARGLALPMADHGGWRVETGLPDELRRYVFAGPSAEIHKLAIIINKPHILIKMCGSGKQLLSLLPPRWQLLPGRFLMTQAGNAGKPVIAGLHAEYRLEISTKQAISVARIFAKDGSIAASAKAVEYAGVFIFDSVVTAPAHRRRGLGRALMAALASTQIEVGARRVLVATEDGSKLYSSLGWHIQSPYSTAIMTSLS